MNVAMTKMKKIILFTVVMILATGIVSAIGDPTITAPPDVTKEATGIKTIVTPEELGYPDTTCGEPPCTVDNNASTDGFSLGTTVVEWKITDNLSVTFAAEQLVTIKDTTAPTITAPADIDVQTTGTNLHIADIGNATVNDLVDPDPTVTNDVPDGNNFPIGQTTVTWKVCDNLNNCNTDTQLITITEQLTIIAPADVTKEATGGKTTVNLGTADTSGGVPPVSTTNDAPVDGFPIGQTIVTWSATDSANHTAIDTQLITITEPPQLTIIAPADVTKETTGYKTTVNLGTANTSGGVPPVSTTSDAPVDGFPIGQTTVTWTATDSANHIVTDIQLVTITPIKLNITNYSPISLLIEERAPSHVRFEITTNRPANIIWRLDGVSTPGGQSVIQDFYDVNIPTIGSHTVTVFAQNETDNDTKTWNWNVKGTLEISAHPSSINIGEPTNVTLRVSRRCGIETGDSCTGRTPVAGANVSLTGISTGSGVTNDTGLFIITINATTNGTINATAIKSGYISNSTNIISDVAPVPTPPANSGGGSSGISPGGGSSSGGGTPSAEPYENIFKYESRETFMGLTPTILKYTVPEIAVYEVAITGNDSSSVTLRIEALRDTSKLVSMSSRGNVYKNINMWANSKRIKNAVIRYKIENSWISNSGVSQSDIKMSRWDNTAKKWNELPTNVTSRDDSYTYFESTTEGFSSFAISGIRENIPYVTNDVIPDNTGSLMPNNAQRSSSIDILGKRKNPVMFEIIVSIIIIALAVYLLRV